MIETLKSWSGVVALVILAIMGIAGWMKSSQTSFGTAADCGSTTCFTTLAALTSFQDDGTAIFNGATTFAAAVTQSGIAKFTGGVYASSTLQTSNNFTVYTTNSATSTSSFGCIQTTATSTATPIKIVPLATAQATTTFNSTASIGGALGWQYGNCP